MPKFLVMAFVLTFSLSWCEKTKPEPQPPESSPINSQYIRRQNNDSVIVFVHGVFGGATGTWTNGSAYWPKMLTEDHDFDGTDVYVYSYPTPYLSQTYTIDELIENMRLVFDKDEIFTKHKKAIFLVHSMGGIVVRGYLKRYQSYASQVQLIYFFATPTSGAHVANLAKMLSKNPQLHGMVPANSDSYVADLQRDWRALPIKVLSKCAYEIRTTFGWRIVDEQSASALCDGPVDPIDRDHIQIVKPSDRNDVPYYAFRQAYMSSRAAVQPPGEQRVFGIVPTARSVEVDCGQTRDDTATIPPPIELQPQQTVMDAVASLQESTNLKEGQVEKVGMDRGSAKIHYKLVGPDRQSGTNCPAKGTGVILISFVVSQPPTLSSPGVIPVKEGDISLALLSRPGTVSLSPAAKVARIEDHRVLNSAALIKYDQIKLSTTAISGTAAMGRR